MARILLVEDNEMNRDMLSRRLIRQGFEVEIASNGREGLEAATRGCFDLILMDLSLPEIDGWEVTRRLKANPDTRKTPIIALTAHAMAGDRDRAFEAGCDEYEIKPIEFHRLLAKIDIILRSRAMEMMLDLDPDSNDGEQASDSSSASLLRHELITPVNHILGFAELLVDDANQKGRFYRAQGLRSIREIGKVALGLIDHKFCQNMSAAGYDEAAAHDLSGLREALIGPSDSIIEACDAIEETSSEVPDRETFLEDLSKIRNAASRMVEVVDQLSGTIVAVTD